MQSIKFDLDFEENRMSSTHQPDWGYGLRGIFFVWWWSFDKQAWYRRGVGVGL